MNNNFLFKVQCFVLIVVLVCNTSKSQDWCRWRGPNGNGITQDSNWNPSSVSNQKVLWKREIGVGYSSVAVCGNSVFASGNIDGKDIVHCLDIIDGKTKWSFSYPGKGGDLGGPRATPVIDDGFVFVLTSEGKVICLDAQKGSLQWQASLDQETGAKPPKWDHSGSVLIEGNLAIINANKAGVALDKKTGKIVWASESGIGGYSTPVLYDHQGRKSVVLFGQSKVLGADVKTGKELWSFEWKTSHDVNASDPIVSDKKVFITSGYGRGCALIDISKNTPELLWSNKNMASHFGSPVLIDGYIYGITGNAGQPNCKLVCIEFANGELKWSKNMPFASLICANKNLIILTENGELIVVKASNESYNELARSLSIIPKTCWTAPVLAHGKIFCRNHQGTLAVVDVK